MKRALCAAAILLAIVAVVLVLNVRRVNATARSQLPNAQTLRFRLIADEPIAGPDGRSIVTGWRVLVFEDLKRSRCYATFTNGTAGAIANDVPCRE